MHPSLNYSLQNLRVKKKKKKKNTQIQDDRFYRTVFSEPLKIKIFHFFFSFIRDFETCTREDFEEEIYYTYES